MARLFSWSAACLVAATTGDAMAGERDLTDRIGALLEPVVEAMGYATVRIMILGQKRPRLQIMVERRDGRAMTVDDCAEVSRAISAVLDVEDPIAGAHVLEVSSPGIDRPLVRLGDFDRFAGFDARIETGRPIGERRRFTGRLLGTAADDVRLRTEAGVVQLPHAEIVRAKLILTDALIAALGNQSRETALGDEPDTD
jgi:ribosome maturation factor RimP